MPLFVLHQARDQGDRAFSPPAESLGQLVNFRLESREMRVRFIALRFPRFDSVLQLLYRRLHGIHSFIGWLGRSGAPVLRIFRQGVLEDAKDGQSKQAFDTVAHLFAHVPAGVALHLLAVEEKELRKTGLQETLSDPVAIPSIPIFVVGWRCDGRPVFAFVDLKLVVGNPVHAVRTEVPRPLDLDPVTGFILPFELDDALRRSGLRRPAMKRTFEKLAVARLETVPGVVAHCGSRPRDEDQAVLAEQAQGQRLEQRGLPVLVGRHDEGDVPLAMRARKLESRVTVGAPVDELNGA